MRSIMLLPLVAICLEKTDVGIWCMFVCMSVVVTVFLKKLGHNGEEIIQLIKYICDKNMHNYLCCFLT